MKCFFHILFLFSVAFTRSQNTCETGFITDSLFLPGEEVYYQSSALVTPPSKNGTTVKLFLHQNKYYLMLELKSNLYFDKSEMLEVKSGSKSFYQKNIKQYQKDKHTAFFVFEIYKNYIATLKDEGITSYVFNKNELIFTKSETKEIKKIAACFYNTVNAPPVKK